MKTTVAPYQTAALCVRIVCTNGLVVRLTTYPFDLIMSNATVYKTDSGYEATAYNAGTTFAASAIDIEGFVGVAGITRAQIASGLFDGARVYILKCDFLNPVEDYEQITCGLFGKTELMDDRYRIEGMALIDALNQTTGITYTALCQRTFGDAGCGIDLSTIDVTGAVTHVTSSSVIRDSSRGEAADYFTNGSIQFTSGQNAGLKPLTIRAYAADGTITTHEGFYYTPQVGDTFVMIPGCRKRKVDCQAWNNVPNAMAFWDMPTNGQYAQIGGIQ